MNIDPRAGEQQLTGFHQFEGKTVLITGATSGIGRALALLLAGSGANVVAHGRTRERLDALARDAKAGRLIPVSGDLKKNAGGRAVEDAIREWQPEVLILNAGYSTPKKYAREYTDSEVQEMLRVNLASPILCARTFTQLPEMARPRRLALILSTSCFFAREQMALYVTCKVGLMGFGRALQQEARRLNMRTTLFYPGRTDTGFRDTPNSDYMSPESVAHAVASVLSLADDLVPHEFTFRPPVDTYI